MFFVCLFRRSVCSWSLRGPPSGIWLCPSLVSSFGLSLRSFFVDTVVLAVGDHRERPWFPCSLRKITRYEFFRYAAARFPRCFVVTVSFNVEFERSVRVLALTYYFVNDVRRPFRVLDDFELFRFSFVSILRVLGWHFVCNSIGFNAFYCSVAVYYGPLVSS